MSYLERAITDGHAKFSGEGKQQKILYVAVNHTERYADSEEQVRATNSTRVVERLARRAVAAHRAARTFWQDAPIASTRSARWTRASSRSARTSTSTREKPEEYRFYKGDPNNDRQPDSQEALIGAIKKCHQTLWAGGKFSPSAAFGELCEMMEDRG
jgi:hypothetical protein